MKWHTPLSWLWKLLLLLAVLADSDDGDAERGRRNLQGRNHPTSHLPAHNR